MSQSLLNQVNVSDKIVIINIIEKYNVAIPSKSGQCFRQNNNNKEAIFHLDVAIPSKSGQYFRLPVDFIREFKDKVVAIPSKSGQCFRQT